MRSAQSRKAWVLAANLLIVLTPSSTDAKQKAHHECMLRPSLNEESFRSVMQTVAEGWNRRDARSAASCFAEDAIYSAPPSTPRRGRKALYEFFGGQRTRIADGDVLAPLAL